MLASKNKKQQGSIKTWLMIIFVVGFWAWFFTLAPKQAYISKLQSLLNAVSTEKNTQPVQISDEFKTQGNDTACIGELPKHGQAVLLGNQNISAKLHARFYVMNEHHFPVMLTFIDTSTLEPLGAVFMAAGKDKQMHIPVGEYDLKVQSGHEWCNFNDGFTDGADIHTDKVLQIKANNVANMRLIAYGNSPSNIMLSFSDSLGVQQQSNTVNGSGSLMLKRIPGGHFAAEGTINRLPVSFLKSLSLL